MSENSAVKALYQRDRHPNLLEPAVFLMGVFSSEDSNGSLEVDKVAPFLLKLYEIVSSPVSDDLVCWSEHGETFKIVNRTKFAGVCSRLHDMWV